MLISVWIRVIIVRRVGSHLFVVGIFMAYLGGLVNKMILSARSIENFFQERADRGWIVHRSKQGGEPIVVVCEDGKRMKRMRHQKEGDVAV